MMRLCSCASTNLGLVGKLELVGMTELVVGRLELVGMIGLVVGKLEPVGLIGQVVGRLVVGMMVLGLIVELKSARCNK